MSSRWRPRLYEILDDRFRTGRCANGDSRLERSTTAAAGPRGRSTSPPGGSWSGATSPTTGCCAGTRRPARSASSAPPPATATATPLDRRGPADHLRAGQPPGHPHRARRHAHRPRRPLRGQAAQQPERRGRTLRRLDLVLRPGLRHHQRLRGLSRRARDRRLQRLPHRPGDRRGAPRRRRLRRPQRPGLLARRAAVVRLRHPAPARSASSTSARTARSPTARSSPRRRRHGRFDNIRFDDGGRLWAAAMDGGVHCYDPVEGRDSVSIA